MPTACYAVGTPGHSLQLTVQGRAPAAHKGLIHAAKALAATALDVLTSPELLETAKACFAAIRADAPFRNPIGDDVAVPFDIAAR